MFSIVSVFAVSLISLIGVFTLSIQANKFKKWLLYMVSFAAGAMLGDGFIHLLPESIAKNRSVESISFSILAGIVIFFILEKIIFWRHCHQPTSENHIHPVGPINLIGDGFHNFIDGIIIAASYIVSIPLGVATTVAVLMHEIPQEIGDFGVLLHAGYTRKQAIGFNFLSASAATLGTIITLLVGEKAGGIVDFLLPFTIGGFIYIAAADLIPEVHHERHTSQSFLQLFYFLLGIGLMALLLLIG
ncbi:MAG: ZIP family metal transporter [Candidatus Kerfeldbacteria bacterium CG08_land_8_20_14_0_20_43_14]|uniref:ZIP family metal transporter n=1 Tax=Candidatus Kerfeldbacteria bacterium CG08_land_8_20_14_0_20_43_14 TaxID=2014246 RepID=A0A2H0YT21_9BACT|nr:MAG: ZIP family metal transporter [Candidatus Kerfeldbacteria bacterium CG08_land_8_20_14_0_20_43_14]